MRMKSEHPSFFIQILHSLSRIYNLTLRTRSKHAMVWWCQANRLLLECLECYRLYFRPHPVSIYCRSFFYLSWKAELMLLTSKKKDSYASWLCAMRASDTACMHGTETKRKKKRFLLLLLRMSLYIIDKWWWQCIYPSSSFPWIFFFLDEQATYFCLPLVYFETEGVCAWHLQASTRWVALYGQDSWKDLHTTDFIYTYLSCTYAQSAGCVRSP
jgi:hypothetical protein